MLWVAAGVLPAVGAGVGAGPADSGLLLGLPLPPTTAATMKTIATMTRPAIPFSAPGIGWRRWRLGFGAGAAFGAPAGGASAAGLAAAGFLSGAGLGVAAAFSTF